MPNENRHRLECPRCGGRTTRVRRTAEDRAAAVTVPTRRYRCVVEGCGWEDTIAIAPGLAERGRLRARRRERASQPRRLMAAVSIAAGLAFAVVGARAWQHYRDSASAVDRIVAGGQVLPFGESHDGDPLASGHPLLVRANTGVTRDVAPQDVVLPPGTLQTAALRPMGAGAGPAGAVPMTEGVPAPRDDTGSGATGTTAPEINAVPGDKTTVSTDKTAAPTVKTAAPSEKTAAPSGKAGTDAGALQIRQNCAWGDPGRNPYRGTVEEALEGARLPPEVVARLSGMIRAGQATDRLEITNASIRTVHQYREYDPRSIAMTFGKTLCVNTRVNFKPNHLERADLYEVADASGATYSVMVPYVCGNVSVLADRAERPDGTADAPVMVLGPDGRPVVRKSTAPLPGVIAGNIGTRKVVGAGGDTTAQVPVPGTLANLLGGFALLGWFLRRRLRARDGD